MIFYESRAIYVIEAERKEYNRRLAEEQAKTWMGTWSTPEVA
jgi:hypothetical protein